MCDCDEIKEKTAEAKELSASKSSEVENSGAKIDEPSTPKFSEEEIAEIKKTGEKLSLKAVLYAVIECIKYTAAAKNDKTGTAEKLIAQLEKKCKYTHSGFIQIEFNETPLKLNISLSLVPANYTVDIDIPSDSYTDVINNRFLVLRAIARTWWKQYCMENVDEIKQITDYCDAIDFSELVFDREHPDTMYFSPDVPLRVGLFCYYVDKNNKPFYKPATSSSSSKA